MHEQDAKDKKKQLLVVEKDRQDSTWAKTARQLRLEEERYKVASRERKRVAETAAALSTTLIESVEE